MMANASPCGTAWPCRPNCRRARIGCGQAAAGQAGLDDVPRPGIIAQEIFRDTRRVRSGEVLCSEEHGGDAGFDRARLLRAGGDQLLGFAGRRPAPGDLVGLILVQLRGR